MNAAQANALSLPDILKILGYTPQKERGHDHLYFSPLREEKTPSFHVHIANNIWYDFGLGEGGDVVDFARAYLESKGSTHSVSEALRFLGDMHPFSLPKRMGVSQAQDSAPALKVMAVRKLRYPKLLRYLSDERMIPLELARKHLVEIEAHNHLTGQTLIAAAMKNVDGGYELRNSAFKGCAGHKDVTVLRGTEAPATEVHVFEGMMDMLSALADQERDDFAGDIIVLHSLACLSKALPYIENYESYRRVVSWLDNDNAGEKATAFLRRVVKQQEHLAFHTMNSLYAPAKDVNEARVTRLKTPLLR